MNTSNENVLCQSSPSTNKYYQQIMYKNNDKIKISSTQLDKHNIYKSALNFILENKEGFALIGAAQACLFIYYKENYKIFCGVTYWCIYFVAIEIFKCKYKNANKLWQITGKALQSIMTPFFREIFAPYCKQIRSTVGYDIIPIDAYEIIIGVGFGVEVIKQTLAFLVNVYHQWRSGNLCKFKFTSEAWKNLRKVFGKIFDKFFAETITRWSLIGVGEIVPKVLSQTILTEALVLLTTFILIGIIANIIFHFVKKIIRHQDSNRESLISQALCFLCFIVIFVLTRLISGNMKVQCFVFLSFLLLTTSAIEFCRVKFVDRIAGHKQPAAKYTWTSSCKALLIALVINIKRVVNKLIKSKNVNNEAIFSPTKCRLLIFIPRFISKFSREFLICDIKDKYPKKLQQLLDLNFTKNVIFSPKNKNSHQQTINDQQANLLQANLLQNNFLQDNLLQGK